MSNFNNLHCPGRIRSFVVVVVVAARSILFRVIEIGWDGGVGHGILVTGLRAPSGARGVVGGVPEALGEALAVRNGDGEALPAEALVAVVVGGEEERLALLEEGHGDRHGLRGGVGGVCGGPLHGVGVGGVAVVAELVGGGVVGLDHRVVGVCVENCIVENNKNSNYY